MVRLTSTNRETEFNSTVQYLPIRTNLQNGCPDWITRFVVVVKIQIGELRMPSDLFHSSSSFAFVAGLAKFVLIDIPTCAVWMRGVLALPVLNHMLRKITQQTRDAAYRVAEN